MGNATLCARVVVDELLTRGVREVVLSPGSRSAPLAYEVFEADRIGLLRLHVRIDERSAGFVALGLAKSTGSPVAVLTTSGTAAANLYPAVLEAWHAHVPLLAITASRPRALVHTGSNQTADQEQLFGRHVRGHVTLSDESSDARGWRFEVARMTALATGSRTRAPGPVQLNVELSDPLVPSAFDSAAPTADQTIAATTATATPIRLGDGPQTVIVAGDLPVERGRAVAGLAAEANVPLLAEPSSNAREGPAALSAPRILASSVLAEEIERVVMVGRPTLSRPISRLLARAGVELVVVSAYADWVDPGRNAAQVVDGVVFERPAGGAWLQRWRAADETVRAGLAALLAAQTYLSGPALAAELWQALDWRDTLFVGSSNPIRDLDLAPVSASPPAVYANRGLAGIDGSISTAIGIALAAERPTHALLGDLTTLHDAAGLVVGPGEPRVDLRLLVSNDDGGSIFATLEQGAPAHSGAYERIFGTPHRASFEHLAAAMGHSYRRVGSTAELAETLAEPPVGIELVEASVDRQHRRTLDAAITALAETV